MSHLMRVPYPSSGIQIVGVEMTYFSAQQSLVCPIPAGIQQGDLMVFVQFNISALGVPLNMTTSPRNYTLVTASSTGEGNPRALVYRKLAAAGETAFSINQTGSNYYVVIIAAYRGASTVRQYATSPDASSPYESTSLTIGTTPAIVSVYASARNPNFTLSPGDCTIDAPYEDFYSHPTAAGRGVLAHVRATSPGTYGTYPIEWTGSVGNSRSVLLEIR